MRAMISFTGLFLLLAVNSAQAVTYIENFNADFPTWESGWLGTNSNIQNYYGIGADRGNNPDGLWIADGSGDPRNANILFTPSFGNSLTSLSFDVAGWASGTLNVYDSFSSLIYSSALTLTEGAWSYPGVYVNYSITSTTGISGFSFLSDGGRYMQGNTSIDNVVATDNIVTPVPEPETYAMLLSGLGLIGFMANRRKYLNV